MKLFLIHLSTDVDSETFERLSQILPQTAQDRIKKFRLQEDAIRSLAGRLAPIWYLRREGLIPSGQQPIFGSKEKGKPILKEPILNPPLAFNTSHDGQYILLGITRGSETDIGVDLMEYPSDSWEVQRGISEQLSLDEKSILALSRTDQQRSQLLTRLWTLKEGYVKATGDGIVFGLERIGVEMEENGKVQEVRVDGKDVKMEGWNWSYGDIAKDPMSSTEDLKNQRYGWTVFWKGDNQEDSSQVKLEHIPWDDFTRPFLDV